MQNKNMPSVKQVDFSGLLRTGRHCLWSCFLGLYDLVSNEEGHVISESKVTPVNFYEKGSLLVYAMGLREKDVNTRPLFLRKEEFQSPYLPEDQDVPRVFMIRDPYAVLYSLYNFNPDAYGLNEDSVELWLEKNANYYFQYYEKAQQFAKSKPEMNILVRYESLISTPSMLKNIVNFIGLEPKLNLDFVHWCMLAENSVKPGRRSFFQSGLNNKWKGDADWVKALMSTKMPDFSLLGYESMEELKSNISTLVF